MRLTNDERAAIKNAASDIFGQKAVVRLFGSRVDDKTRGGDIDLHLEIDADQIDRHETSEFKDRVWEAMNELKVDLIVTKRGSPLSWIERAAYRDGVIL